MRLLREPALSQAGNGGETTCRAAFGSIGVVQVGSAGSAYIMRFDAGLVYAGVEQLHSYGVMETETAAVGIRINAIAYERHLASDRVDHLRAHGEAAGVYARADAGEDIPRAATVLIAHSTDSLCCDVGDGPPPPGMRDSHDGFDGVEQQKRGAVRRETHKHGPGLVGNKGIGVDKLSFGVKSSPASVGFCNYRHLGAVRLAGSNEITRGNAEGLRDCRSVPQDGPDIISDVKRQIQCFERTYAAPAPLSTATAIGYSVYKGGEIGQQTVAMDVHRQGRLWLLH